MAILWPLSKVFSRQKEKNSGFCWSRPSCCIILQQTIILMIPRAIRKRYRDLGSVYSAVTCSLFKTIWAKRREMPRSFPQTEQYNVNGTYSKATSERRECFLCGHLQPVQLDPGNDVTSNPEQRNASIVSTNASIVSTDVFLEDGYNKGVFVWWFVFFRNLFALPFSQDETE